jgi:hypothetical protein
MDLVSNNEKRHLRAETGQIPARGFLTKMESLEIEQNNGNETEHEFLSQEQLVIV